MPSARPCLICSIDEITIPSLADRALDMKIMDGRVRLDLKMGLRVRVRVRVRARARARARVRKD